ncbi:uncharacterized protein LOC130140500 [Syzygium oleosum]|uniref:uncharacterized protein LOC130140500 n=1 Tax=Syzygium oleosum TaxID=219896 RepID=UPI0024BA3C95|nr:uncharacterized protein LOC130140500 [Syzygium oleosum]
MVAGRASSGSRGRAAGLAGPGSRPAGPGLAGSGRRGDTTAATETVGERKKAGAVVARGGELGAQGGRTGGGDNDTQASGRSWEPGRTTGLGGPGLAERGGKRRRMSSRGGREEGKGWAESAGRRGGSTTARVRTKGGDGDRGGGVGRRRRAVEQRAAEAGRSCGGRESGEGRLTR